jgi:hypothetical protein
MRYAEGAIFVRAAPLFHIADFPAIIAAPAFGASQPTLPKFNPQSFCEAVERERVSHTVLVPTMINLLTQFPEVKKYDWSSVEVLASGDVLLVRSLADHVGSAEPHRNPLASSPCLVSSGVPFRHGFRLLRQLDQKSLFSLRDQWAIALTHAACCRIGKRPRAAPVSDR